MAVNRLAPEDLQEIIAGVFSSWELMSGIVAQLQQALAPIYRNGNESENCQHTLWASPWLSLGVRSGIFP